MTNRPQTGRRYRTAAPARGKREQPASRGGGPPSAAAGRQRSGAAGGGAGENQRSGGYGQVPDKLLDLMGGQTDFRAAFSAVGRAVSGQGAVGQALNDAYTAVFGPL
ncbi:MAG: hypothetical protein V8S97_03280 [Oscillospiraceae bacterium]